MGDARCRSAVGTLRGMAGTYVGIFSDGSTRGLRCANHLFGNRMNLPAQIDRWPKRWRELYEERAGLIEFQANVSRGTAEIRAEQDMRKLAAEERTA